MTTKKPTEKKKREKAPRVLLDVSGFPHNEKGAAIVPDQFMEENYKNLPDGTVNESGTYRAYNGGKMRSLGKNTEEDKEIHSKGGKALQANIRQRQSFAEMFDIMLRQKDENGVTYQEKIALAMMNKASAGDTKAAVFVRDTSGEMPVNRQQITAEVMTDADRKLIENIQKRLEKGET